MDIYIDPAGLQQRFAAELATIPFLQEAAFMTQDLIIPGSLGAGPVLNYPLPPGTDRYEVLRFPFTTFENAWPVAVGPNTVASWVNSGAGFFGYSSITNAINDPNKLFEIAVMKVTPYVNDADCVATVTSNPLGLSVNTGLLPAFLGQVNMPTDYFMWTEMTTGTGSPATFVATGMILVVIAR